MAASNSMAFELMNLVSPFNYTNNVLHLNKSDILDQPAFDKLELSAKYWLDVRHCYRYGKKNPQQLFEIFGCFNNEEPEDVRSDICNCIKMEMKFYGKVGTVHLLFISNDIEKWLKTMKNNLVELSAKYWLDVRHCYRYGKKNPQQLFEIFGCFNNEEPEDVRSDICNRIKMEMKFYGKVGTVHLLFISNNIEKWLKTMKNNHNYGDPLMLYALSRTFQRHLVVLCANCAWSTVGTDDPIDSDQLLEICHVKLVYIGHNMFSELREKTVPSILPVLSNHNTSGAASTSVSGINQPGYNINVGLEPPPNTVPDDDVPPVDTLDYIDLSDFSDLEGSSEDTIIYPLPDNTVNTHETPFLNVDDTTDRPIGTGYYTKVDDNSDVNTGDTPRSDICLSANTEIESRNKNTTNQEDKLNNITETSMSVLGSNDDIPRNDLLQGINRMHNISVSGVNTENVPVSVSGLNGNMSRN